MSNTALIATVVFVIISILFLIAITQNSVNESRLIGTPTIPREKAVLTSFASTKIEATSDEVFSALLNYKNYPASSPFSGYKWKEVTADGVPMVGSAGSFKLSIDGFPPREIPIKLSLLDREHKRIAELTAHYPPWLLRSERVQEVLPDASKSSSCEYRTYQTFEGVAAYYLLLNAQEELLEGQKLCASDLKTFVENGKHQNLPPT